jgi:hypothetical protein
MTIMTVSQIVNRVKHAPKTRSISVFVKDIDGKRQLDAVPTNTVDTLRRKRGLKPYHPSHKCPTCGHIASPHAEEWIGDFNWNMPRAEVEAFLTKAREG